MITDMISTAPGFQTSVNIAYDLNNSEKIKSLIPTSTALSLFEEFLLSTDNAATNRAKILIGAYGKGKSHIILSILSFLCKVVESPETRKPDIEKNEQNIAALLSRVKEANADLYEYAKDYLVSSKRLLPVIINGSNTSLVQSFMGALYNTLKSNQLMTLMPDTHFQAAINMIRRWEAEYPETLIRFKATINMPLDEFISHLANFDVEAYSTFEKIYPSLTAGSEFNPFAGFDVIELYEKVIEKLPEVGYTGIIVVYDEFSKYLESSITKASISDIKMLQDFAEKCNRSGAKQLHLLLISHKEIENYIDVLPKQKVDGWKGVSERFGHIRMHSDFSQIYEVISQAIIKQDDLWMNFCKRNELRFEDLRQRFCNSKLFADCDETGKTAAFVGCYPLHPITTFMLPRISEKVAQNERTLFTFISGQEATTLSKVMERLSGDFPLITPDVLYDYFAPQMRKEVYTSEIHQLYRLTSSILAKFSPDTLHAKIIKALSLIYCLGEFERLAPTVDTILSIYVDDQISAERIENVITDLVQKQCVVYLKRSNAYLKLKESSGVDVYQAIADLVQKRSNIMTVANLLNSANHEPYAYPIRYNDRREMTRFFQFVFIDSNANNGYAVVFVDENGKAIQRMFDRVERSKRSDVLYRKIESAIRDMGHSVSPQEKRQVLMEILILSKLVRIFCRSTSLSADGVQLHFVGFGPLAGKDILSLEITVHHDNRCGVTIQVANNNWHGFQPSKLTSVFTTMTGDQLIATVAERPCNSRNKDAVLLDAVYSLLHCIVITHGERMIRKGVKFGKLNTLNHFGGVVRFHTASLFQISYMEPPRKLPGGKPLYVTGAHYLFSTSHVQGKSTGAWLLAKLIGF